jgi:hypothetical protein
VRPTDGRGSNHSIDVGRHLISALGTSIARAQLRSPARKRIRLFITSLMESVHIERQHDGSRGTYIATVPGIDGTARLAYRQERPGVIAAVHTETSDALRGKGVALKLVERMVEDARNERAKIRALCSYVDRERQKHAEWADVFIAG